MKRRLGNIITTVITTAGIGVLYWIRIGLTVPISYTAFLALALFHHRSMKQLLFRIASIASSLALLLGIELLNIPPQSLLLVIVLSVLIGLAAGTTTNDIILLFPFAMLPLLAQITNILTLSVLRPIIHPVLVVLIQGGVYIGSFMGVITYETRHH